MTSTANPTAKPIRYIVARLIIGGSDYAFARRWPNLILEIVAGLTPYFLAISPLVQSALKALISRTCSLLNLVAWCFSFTGNRSREAASWQFSPRVPTDKWSGFMQGGLSQL